MYDLLDLVTAQFFIVPTIRIFTSVSRKHSTPNFPKNEHFLPPDTIGVHLGALFSWNTRFEIRPFALLPTI